MIRKTACLLIAFVAVACDAPAPPAATTAQPTLFIPNRLDLLPEVARPILERSVAWLGGPSAFAQVGSVTTTMRASRGNGSVLHTATVGADGSVVLRRDGEPKPFTEIMGAHGGVGWLLRAGEPRPVLVDADEVRRRATIVQSLNALGPILGTPWLQAEVLEPRMVGSIECDVVRLHGTAGLVAEFVCERSTGRPMSLSFSVPGPNGNRVTESRWLAWSPLDVRRYPTIIDTRSDQGAVGLVVQSAVFSPDLPTETALPPEVVAMVTNGDPLSRMDAPPPPSAPAIPATPAEERPADAPTVPSP